MANIGDILQYQLANTSSTISLDPNLSVKIGLSVKEKKVIFHDDLNCGSSIHYNYKEDNSIDLEQLVPIEMTINYANNTSETIQLGQTFMYEAQVAMKINNITFNRTPPGSYLEVVYE